MEFATFQLLCPYNSLAYVYQDDHTRMKPVCNRSDRRPEGSSWGKCDEAHCPYFGVGIVGKNVAIYNNGMELGKCESITATVVLQPEDYEQREQQAQNPAARQGGKQ